jgi:MFS transporter, ACS family, hexuronate transporter
MNKQDTVKPEQAIAVNVNEAVGKYRWTICALIFFATTINYLDRAVISLLKDKS